MNTHFKDNKLASENNSKTIQHVAILMDGNRRWAKKRGLSDLEGHRAGAENLEKIVKTILELEIPFLTCYAFSTENWKRDPSEVDYLMKLFQDYLVNKKDMLIKNQISLSFIGDLRCLSQPLQSFCLNSVETKEDAKLKLILAINYGSRNEIVRAVKKIMNEKNVDLDQLDEKSFSSYLDTTKIPDPDIIIRTSGEQRLSNFLLWQAAYSEFFFVKETWPEFSPEHLLQVIKKFHKRCRRWGGT